MPVVSQHFAIADHFCLEIFCGKARLSAALRSHGFQVFSIDKIAQKHVPILILDVANFSQRKLLVELLQHPLLFYAHFAPACGTASAARDIPIPGEPDPPRPLRSLEFPLGFDSLQGTDRLRVDAANYIYSFTAEHCTDLHLRKIGWSIENPGSSLMWVHPDIAALQNLVGVRSIAFHTCMYGAPRRKETAIWTNVNSLCALALTCDGRHQHLKWGIVKDKHKSHFATKEECAYNVQLSRAWAQLIHHEACAIGLTEAPSTLQEVAPEHSRQQPVTNKAILGSLPRGKVVPPLLTDFLQPQVHSLPDNLDRRALTVGTRLPDNSTFPAGTRLLRFCFKDGEGGVNEEQTKVVLGIPRSPWEYLNEVCKLIHPVLQHLRLPKVLLDTMAIKSHKLQSLRASWAKAAVEEIQSLRDDERSLHGKMAPHANKILRKKNIIFFSNQMKAFDYPDAKVAYEMAEGFPLFGWLPASNVFPSMLRPPSIHPDCLKNMAASITARTLAVTKPSDSHEDNVGLWEATVAEVEEGFSVGPFEPSALHAGCVVSPRFGLWQKAKLRPIDNFSASSVNQCTGLPEKLKVEAVDEAAAVIKQWAAQCGPGVELVGKTYDLRKAYRQLAIHPDHLKYAWVATCDAAGSPKVFQLQSMPFGATASVAAFLRVAEGIKQIGLHSLGLVWTSFFDDFICICRKSEAAATDKTVSFLFDALGWDVSRDPAKNSDFGPTFQALGVVFDLTTLHQGFFTISNTEGRREELVQRINGILDTDCLAPTEALSLRSRLLFAEGQIFGRNAKRCLGVIAEPGLASATMRPLSAGMKRSLEWMRDRVLLQPPRKIAVTQAPTFALFLDGACEGVDERGASIGGLLCDMDGNGIHCFGETLPSSVVKAWSERGISQVIFEAEVLPYSVALKIFAETIRGSNLLVFIDNEAARHSWISASARSDMAARMIDLGTVLESELNVSPYFCRVPTFSNLADGPSRDDFELCFKLGAKRIRVSPDLMCSLADLYV